MHPSSRCGPARCYSPPSPWLSARMQALKALEVDPGTADITGIAWGCSKCTREHPSSGCFYQQVHYGRLNSRNPHGSARSVGRSGVNVARDAESRRSFSLTPPLALDPLVWFLLRPFIPPPILLLPKASSNELLLTRPSGSLMTAVSLTDIVLAQHLSQAISQAFVQIVLMLVVTL